MIENEEVKFEFKDHYGTEHDVRKAIEDYIRNGEFDACLNAGDVDSFSLGFKHAIREDRQPVPGVFMADASPVRFRFGVSSAVGVVSHPQYPLPPSDVSLNPSVDTLYNRYMGYRKDREPLASPANFCLTVLEASTGEQKKKRKAAAIKYNIDYKVLHRIADLAANKGG